MFSKIKEFFTTAPSESPARQRKPLPSPYQSYAVEEFSGGSFHVYDRHGSRVGFTTVSAEGVGGYEQRGENEIFPMFDTPQQAAQHIVERDMKRRQEVEAERMVQRDVTRWIESL